MTTHTIAFRYTTAQTLTAKIFTAADALEDEASAVTEATNRKQWYTATFQDVAAGDYFLVYYSGGDPVGYEFVRFTGVDGETGVLLEERTLTAAAVAEIQSGLATAANQVIIIDGIGFVLAQEVGSVADAQTAAAVYVRSFNNSTYTITHSGLTSAGVRGTASLVKS